jgi:SAM-dependent methyltransferase
MDAYTEDRYGEEIAEIYDQLYSEYNPLVIERLVELAGGGPALELGIGTGRVALPLKEHGVAIHGVDASPAMVARLHAKPGGAEIPVTLGSFENLAVDGQFTLIYVVFNTFYGLLNQQAQLNCFASVAAHLVPGGRFVLECFVPDMTRFVAGQAVRAVSVELKQVRLDVSEHDPLSQVVTSQHIFLSKGGVRLFPVKLRYIWPSELDLMARLAGLELEARWADWDRSPFTATSGKHISVYRKTS